MPPAGAGAATLPSGFDERTAFSGLSLPTALESAPDGRVFVAEKSGRIKVFSGPGDPSAAVVADLRTQVFNSNDRGLLDIALDPEFSTDPYLYALYTHDAAVGGTAPLWGSPGTSTDSCPDPPGLNGDGCVVSGRLSRFPVDGNAVGPEQVLVEDWCQQYPSHSVGSIVFDDDGALIASAGDGASYNFADWGQAGAPPNPCGDPPAGVGGEQQPPDAEGGALRSQDLRTSSDPAGLDGSVIRVDRSDGSPLPDNPNAGSSDSNEQRIVADGLRNPFRVAIRPGTSELWIADVGWNDHEEVNRSSLDEHRNFGWPCMEGPAPESAYDLADLDVCEQLYAAPASTAEPFFDYEHGANVIPGESCETGSSSISGLGFYEDGPFPAEYDGALFFADYSRGCIWAMKAGSDGVPDPGQIEVFVADAANPVALEAGEDGALYYPDIASGSIKVVRYFEGNQPPTAVLAADRRSGGGPLTVEFDGSGSTDPDPGGVLRYDWDLDGDGDFDDSSEVAPSHTFSGPGTHLVRLRVTDPEGVADTAQLAIQVDNTPPTPSIDSPDPTRIWRVGEEIEFAGSAVDAEQGALGPESLDWELDLYHCPSSCHVHPFERFDGVAGGRFPAPDHEYPSHLLLRLTATDAKGLSETTSVELHPETIEMTMASDPPGAEVALGAVSGPAPFTEEVIVGSNNTIGAVASFPSGGGTYTWASWSHGGLRQQNITAPADDTTLTAFYDGPTSPGGLESSGPLAPIDEPPADPGSGDPEAEQVACPKGTSSSVACERDSRGRLVMLGSREKETFIGSSKADAILTRGGDDLVKGRSGDDRVGGQRGNDVLIGQRGADVMDGGPGQDELRARDGQADRRADCGSGGDWAAVDAARDHTIKRCEHVSRR